MLKLEHAQFSNPSCLDLNPHQVLCCRIVQSTFDLLALHKGGDPGRLIVGTWAVRFEARAFEFLAACCFLF